MLFKKIWQTFIKGQRVRILGFVGQMVSITTTHLCHGSTTVATNNMFRNGWLCLNKMLFIKTGSWPDLACLSLPAPAPKQCFLHCGPQMSTVNIPWELLRNPNYQTSPHTYKISILVCGFQQPVMWHALHYLIAC